MPDLRGFWLAVLLATACGWAQAQRVALTFDDGLDPAKQPAAFAWNGALLAHLRQARVHAMIFPALVRIGGQPGIDLVRAWGEEGHAVGNHTASHRSLSSSRTALPDFIADVEGAHAALAAIPGFRPMLRFPFLKEGDTPQKRDGMRNWMRSNGYQSAPVSIDSSDWFYDQALHGLGSEASAATLKRAYVEHLLDRAAYYDALARRVTGRSPVHVLLLHTNRINAEALPAVIAAFRERGWDIVAPSVAFADPLYAVQPRSLPAGESIVWALARDAGIEGLRFPGEDGSYEEPRLRALGLLP
jgi:peptidoglycan-N-acetylglucosamine deacetylase